MMIKTTIKHIPIIIFAVVSVVGYKKTQIALTSIATIPNPMVA